MMKKKSKAELYHSPVLDQILESITPAEAEKAAKRMMLAAKIDDGIQAKGWKKRDLAKALNKRPSVITKWLSGTHNISVETLFDIEAILNIGLVNVELLDAPPKDISVIYN